jgi:hypothetical protein
MPTANEARLGPEAQQVQAVIELLNRAHGKPRHVRMRILDQAERLFDTVQIPTDADCELRMLFQAGRNAIALLKITLT